MQILIVEDDRHSRAYLQWVLEKYNYHVIATENGADALIAARKYLPDLIISDIMMPIMDGYELCRLVKTDEQLRIIPFIFYTATYLEEREKELGLKLGAVHYLTKPMDIKVLLAIIREVLESYPKNEPFLEEYHDKKEIENSSDMVIDHLHTIMRKLDQKVAELENERSELRKSEQKYRRLIDNLNQEYFFYSYSLQGELTYISSSFEAILGYPKDEYPSCISDSILNHSLNTGVSENRELTRMGYKQPPYELRISHKSGSLHILEINEFPIKNENGEVCSIEGIAHDITHRKKLEQEKIRTESKLRQARKLEALGTLAGGIAHDFNNILSSIIGYTELAFEDVSQNSSLAGKLDQVYRASYRAKELVGQILLFARQSNKEYQPVRIDLIAKETLKLLRASIPANIEIQQRFTTQSQVMADQTEIHQILMNLFTNAAHAMGEKGGILTFSVSDFEPDAPFTMDHPSIIDAKYVHLSVEDTGSGIDPQLMDSIFEPYFTTKDPGKGTGLGLSMVHGMVQKMRGEISVNSELGKGTRFSIYLPAVFQEEGGMKNEVQSLPHGKEHILIIDDEIPITEINRQILERLGYRVTAETSSMKALELFRKNPGMFDIVITDMTMPQMTGDKLAIEIMSIKPDIPVILCTGYNKFITEEKAFALGIRALAIKPVLKEDLANLIRTVLEKNRKTTKSFC